MTACISAPLRCDGRVQHDGLPQQGSAAGRGTGGLRLWLLSTIAAVRALPSSLGSAAVSLRSTPPETAHGCHACSKEAGALHWAEMAAPGMSTLVKECSSLLARQTHQHRCIRQHRPWRCHGCKLQGKAVEGIPALLRLCRRPEVQRRGTFIQESLEPAGKFTGATQGLC